MANTFTNGDLPDPLETAAGRAFRGAVAAQAFGDIQSAANEALAEAGAGVLVSQGWGGGVIDFTAGAATDCCEWRVPRCSSLHDDVQAEAYAGSGVGGSTLTFTSDTTAAAVSVAYAAGAAAWRTPGVLDIGIGGPDAATPYDTITMALDGTDCTVSSVTIRHVPLASPIAAGLVDDAPPIDAGVTVPDVTASAAHGRRLRESIIELRKRPRVLFNWSAVASAVSGADFEPAASLPYVAPVLARRGAFELGRVYQFHVKATADAVDDTVVVLSASGPWGEFEGTVITVPAAAGTAWYAATFTLPEIEGVPALVPFKALRVGFWPVGVGGPRADRSTAIILSAAAWGE